MAPDSTPRPMAAWRWDWPALRATALREARTVLRDGRAEDAAQEAILRAWRHSERCLRPDAPGAWVRAIARREALRLLDANGHTALAAGAELELRHRWEPVEWRIDIARALRALNPQERRVIAYQYWLDYTNAQAAGALGVPEGTVKIRLHRARRKLRAALALG